MLSWILILTQRWHGKHSHDTADGPQKFHSALTPRIGGISLYLALYVATFLASTSVSQLIFLILLAGLPAFAAGVAEDFTKRVGVSYRLAATMLSGVTAWWLTGYTLSHINIPGIDSLLLVLPVSIVFTAFAVAGVANAINMIDGFNGLASGTLMISFFTLAFIAYEAGDVELVELCLIMLVALSGFFVLNFPFGKIFLGDGGAYLFGFILAWVAVMLPLRNPDVSVWAPLLACAYPVNETVFTILRRFISKDSIGQPDSLHLHSLIKIKISRVYFSHLPQIFRNSLVSPFCWCYALVLSLAAVYFYNSTELLMVCWICSFGLYFLLYKWLTSLKGGSNSSWNIS